VRSKLLISLPFLFCVAMAQGQPGSMSGTLTDLNGDVVDDAPVQITNTATGDVFKVTTSSKGSYAFSKLPAGIYDLSVPLGCCLYAPYNEKGLVVATEQTLRKDILVQFGFNFGTPGDDPFTVLKLMRAKGPAPAGPAPKTADGKPDLSGVWTPIPGGEPYAPPQVLPWAAALMKQRMETNSKDFPANRCLPNGPVPLAFPYPFKFIQAPSIIVMLWEFDTPGHRQIFMDGRGHPRDLNPTWMGHSIGKWEGDTLVIDSSGFNDQSWLTLSGLPHTEQLHVIERVRRPDFGHLEIDITVEDSGTFSAPWKRRARAALAPNDEIMEYLCSENNKDAAHLVGK